jgi:hypothetical protein
MVLEFDINNMIVTLFCVWQRKCKYWLNKLSHVYTKEVIIDSQFVFKRIYNEIQIIFS